MRWIKIFDNWENACKLLPEDKPRILQIGDRRVVIVRRKDNLFAFEALCPHQHEPLHKGHVNDSGEIICPLHSYRFDLRTGRECLERARDMETFPVKIESEIYLGLD